MIKKFILKPVVMFLYNTWSKYFVICPYSLNEPKYMAKGVKPFTALWDDDRFLAEYHFPKFDPLVKQGIVLEQKTHTPTKNRFDEDIILTKVFYYYPGEQWRIKQWELIHEKFPKYRKTCCAREGLLLGYPKKYIRRFMLSNKVERWLYKNGFVDYPPLYY
ncbi:MAG: hypothetical protein ACPG8V_01725 [Alphaproteobacteria bacterium]